MKLSIIVSIALLNLFLGGSLRSKSPTDEVDSLNTIHYREQVNVFPKGRASVIRINNQKQFDELNNQITKAINDGKHNIKVRIGKGLYFFHENHIFRQNESLEDVSIFIEGKDAVLSSFTDFNQNNYVNPWSEFEEAEGKIHVIDQQRKICKIPFKNNISNKLAEQYTRVQITQWYRAPSYKLLSIDNDGVTFYADDLTIVNYSGKVDYSINYDYLYGGKNPRFRLFNASNYQRCDASCFLRLEDCTFYYFGIKGLRFSHNKEEKPLCYLRNVSAKQISFYQNQFEYIRGNVALFNCSNNILFDSNQINNTEGHEVKVLRGCQNVRIINNTFQNCGQRIGQTFCINCGESEYYIANNTICDFGYSAIGVGIWHGNDKQQPSRGIIEHNEIFYSKWFLSNCLRHTLMDSGAIYVWTQNDGTIVRYNYIHDYCGQRSNAAIFCDDGASNCKIYGNIIVNIKNNNLISSRKVNDLLTGYKNNSNNLISHNILDGPIFFMGYGDEERHCMKGENIVLNKIEGNLINRLAYLEYVDDDITIMDWSNKNNYLIIPKRYKKILAKNYTDKYTRRFIKYGKK